MLEPKDLASRIHRFLAELDRQSAELGPDGGPYDGFVRGDMFRSSLKRYGMTSGIVASVIRILSGLDCIELRRFSISDPANPRRTTIITCYRLLERGREELRQKDERASTTTEPTLA